MKNKNFIGRLRCLLFLMALASFNYLSAQTGPNDDFDGDGIINSIDIDDDNDGVPDAVESPNCFYSASEWNKGIKPTTNGVVVSSALPTTTGNFSQLLDNVPGTTAVTFTAGQAIQNANVYLFTFAQPVRLDALYLKFNTASQFANTTKIQGSNTNNGSDWVDLSTAISQVPGDNVTANGLVEVTTSIKYPVTLNTSTAYKYIRITGVAASNIAAQNSSEVYFDFNVANYVASYYPKATCTDANIDGDGILPHFDLDSDGDGCSDAYEAGATTSLATNYKFTGAVGVNGLDNTLETLDNGIVNYTSTYYVYAQNTAMQICKDTDGDGILDINDIDDDNDGVLDTLEQVLESCSGVFTTGSRVIWNSPFTNSNTTATGSATINGTPISVTATTTKVFQGLKDDHWHFGSGTYVGCPDVTTVVSNSVINIFDNDYTVTYTFSRPVRNPSLSFSSFNGTAVLFPHPVYVSGLQGTVSGVSSNTYITTFPATENTVAVIYNGVFNSISFRVAGSDNQGSVLLNVPYVLDAGALTYRLTSGSPFGYLDMDTDGDGIVNRLDLDSDGDGCPDAREAGVSGNAGASASMSASGGSIYTGGIPSGTANAYVGNGTPSQYGANGFFNGIETSSESGIYNGTSTYATFALTSLFNLCTDTDGDGVVNFIDIDDDNDGVVDAVESPSCFYTANEWNTGAKPVYGVTISSGLTTTTGNFSQLTDGVSGTTAVAFSASPTQTIANANVYLFNFAQPVKLDALYLQFNTATQFAGTTKIQGSNTNNGSDWADLSAAIAQTAGTNVTANGGVSLTTSIKYPVTLNTTTAYKYIRITGVAASNIAAQNASEVYFDFNNTAYVASSYPKAITCSNDPDNDTIPNHLDLDSDGDGCPDAREAGVSVNPGAAGVMSTSGGAIYTGGIPSGTANAYVGDGTPAQYGSNGLFNDIEIGENGVYNSTYTYQFANSNILNACLDTDGDGVGDLIDIDDDNDGVLDVMEQNCPNGSKAGVVVTKPAAITYTFSGSQTLANLVDGVDSNTLVMYNPTLPAALSNAEWFRVEFPTARILSSWEVGHYVGQTLFSTTSTYKVQGSNDASIWTDLTGTLTYSRTQNGQSTQANNSNIANFSSNVTAYKYYRYFGVSGSVGTGWATEFYFTDGGCIDIDTDTDGIPNRLDLDSDGDGCPDSLEAGVSVNAGAFTSMSASGGSIYTGGIPSGTANAYVGTGTPSQYGANGFFNGVETAVDSGIYNGSYTYSLYALSLAQNVCTDTDGDNVPDVFDLDDDNDGVLDTAEMGTCTSTYLLWSGDVPQGTLNLGFASSTPSVTTNAVGTTPFTNGTGVTVTSNGTSFRIATVSTSNDSNVAVSQGSYLLYNFTTGSTVPYGTRVSAFGQSSPAAADPTLYPYSLEYQISTDGGINFFSAATGAATYNSGVFTVNSSSPNASLYMLPNTNYTIRVVLYNKTATNTVVGFDNFRVEFCSTLLDTDGDGIPNHLDLDSDGDGCPDTKEAILYNHVTEASIAGDVKNGSGGAVTSTVNTPNAMVPGPYGSNGFADALQSSSNPDAYKYVYSYLFVATNADVSTCNNKFLYDIDSDDDGIPDAVESPTCFYTEAQAMDITEGVTSDFGWTTANPLTNTYDDNTASFGAISATATSIQNKALITFNLPVIDATFVNSITLNVSSSFGAGKWKLQGLDMMTNTWMDLSATAGQALSAGNIVFNNTLQNNTRYYSYRILGVDNVNITNAARLNEFTIQYKNYNASYHRTKMGCNSDADGDGVPNYLDRDSDGDGCPDALEAGISKSLLVPGDFFNIGGVVSGDYVTVGGNYGDNGLGDSVETAPDSGIVNYASTYSQYATNKTLNFCTDTDGDGVPDMIDIDDDNDGVLDVTECAYPATPTTNAADVTNRFAVWSNTGNAQGTNSVPAYLASVGAWTAGNGLTATVNAGNFINISNVNGNSIGDAFGSNEYIEYPFATTADNYNWLYYVRTSANDATNYHWAMLISDDNFVTYDILNIDIPRITSGNVVNDINDYQLKPSTSYKVRTYFWGAPTLTFDDLTMFGYSECDTDTDGVPNRLDLDSDGDGCPDAKESGVSINSGASGSMSASGGSIYTGGIASGTAEAYVGNGTPSQYGANGFFNSIENNDNPSAAYLGTYTYANAINAAISACFCYKPAIIAGTVLDTKQGITSLQRAGTDNNNWPMVRKGAWTALESKTKGFVPNRLTAQQITDIPAANLVEGMMVYHIGLDCLYINTNGTPTGWKCFNTQTCP